MKSVATAFLFSGLVWSQAPKTELPDPPVIQSPQVSDDPLKTLGAQPPGNTPSSGKGGGFGPGENGGVHKVGGGVSAPALLSKVEPNYSEEARKKHIQGVVVLYVEVNPAGRAVNPRVVRSIGYGLDEKAIEAVRKWKFRPGYKDGMLVTVAATIEVNFRLTYEMTGCTFTKSNCLRVSINSPAAGQMIQLSDTQFAIFDGLSWHLADVH